MVPYSTLEEICSGPGLDGGMSDLLGEGLAGLQGCQADHLFVPALSVYQAALDYPAEYWALHMIFQGTGLRTWRTVTCPQRSRISSRSFSSRGWEGQFISERTD